MNSLFPAHDGANYAAIEPLLKLGEGNKQTARPLQEALKERFQHYLNLEKQTWQEMNSAGEQVSLFISGKQFLTPNPYKPGGWLPYQVTGGESERRALSIMQFHIDVCLEKWLSSNPDVIVRPGIESDEAHESAEAGRIIVDHYERKFYKPRVTIEEAMQGLTFGSYIWRVKPDPTKKAITAWREIFENREVALGEGWGKCGDCSYSGTANDFQGTPEGHQCPTCGGAALVEPPASEIVPTMVGKEQVDLPDLSAELVPFSSARWDLSKHVDDSSWLIIQRSSSMTAVRQLFGNIAVPGQPSNTLDILDRLAYAGQAMAGHSRNQDSKRTLYKDPVTIEEHWMSPDEYGDIKIQGDTETVSGETLPADMRLGEAFDGKNICVLGLNEMSVVLGLFVEDHRDYMTQGKWYARSGSGAGRGQQDLVEVQKRLNSDDQQIHTYLRTAGTPAMLVVAEALGEEGKARYIGSPSENIPVSLAALKEGMKLSDVATPAFQPSSVPGQFFEYTYRRLQEYAQFASHAMSFASGLPGVDNKTATGANISQAMTNGLFLPPLTVKGEIRQRIAEIVIKLYPKLYPVDRYFPLGGKNSQQAGKWLSGANLNTDLIYEVVRDSEMPRNSYMKRQDYVAFYQMFGGVIAYLEAREADPQRVGDMERTFDLELESEERNVAESLAFKRVRQMQAQAEMVQDPMLLIQAIQPPILAPSMDPLTGLPTIGPAPDFIVEGGKNSHRIKATWLSEWLDNDDGQQAPQVLRLAVAQLIQLHFQAEGMIGGAMAMQMGAINAAGAAPQQMAQTHIQNTMSPEPITQSNATQKKAEQKAKKAA